MENNANANGFEFLDFDVEDVRTAEEKIKAQSRPDRDKRICACGHPLNSHTVGSSGVVLCTPSRMICPCKNARPVLIAGDARKFLRKTMGPGPEHALARGAKIYAEIIGGGMSGDAFHITAPHPEGLGATLVMQRALKDAGISANEVDYINTHGTSTPLGDGAELKAITNIFGEHAYNLNISSTKSMTGHLLGAAGAVEAIATVLAVQNDIAPPTINHINVDPEIDPKLNLTFNKAQKRTINVAISNTFGFGGHNAAIVVKKYTA
jgi:hypothetical protein